MSTKYKIGDIIKIKDNMYGANKDLLNETFKFRDYYYKDVEIFNQRRPKGIIISIENKDVKRRLLYCVKFKITNNNINVNYKLDFFENEIEKINQRFQVV